MLPGISGVAGSVAGAAMIVTLTDQSVDGFNETATYTISSDGKVHNQSGAILETWLPSGAGPASYQVMASLFSGTAPNGGTLDSWLSCSVARSWSQSKGSNGVRTGVIKVQIRDAAAPNAVKATAYITISVEIDDGL